jgi:hypothetical protein
MMIPVETQTQPEIQMDRLEYMKRNLTRLVEIADATRAKLAERIATGENEAVYEFDWLQGKVQGIIAGQYARYALQLLNGETDKAPATIEEVSEWINRQIDQWTPQRSSSSYSNEANVEKLLAIKEVAQLLGRF